MTFESDVAAISSRSLWARARDRSEASGTAVPYFLDYDGAVIPHGRTEGGIAAPTVTTATVPPLSSKSFQFGSASAYVSGLSVMKGIVGVFASSTLSGAHAANAFNGSSLVTDFWANNGTTSGSVGAQWGTGFVSTGYTFWGRSDATSQTPKDWTFQGSNDGSSWTTLDTRTGQTSPSGVHFTFSNSTSYTYYRLNVSTAQSGVYVALTRFDIDGAPTRTNHGGSSGEVWIVRKTSGSGASSPFQSGTASESYVPYTDGKVYYQIGSSSRADNITNSVTWTNWHIERYVKDSTGVMALWVKPSGGSWSMVHSSNTGAASWAANLIDGAGFMGATSGDFQAEIIHFNAALTASATTGPTAGDALKVDNYLTDTHFSAVGSPGVTGTVAGTSPVGVGAIVGTVPTTGTVAGTSPSGVGALAGTVPTTGTIAGTSPSGVGSFVGTTDNTITGTIAGTSPSGVGAIVGTVPTTGTIAGTSPSGVGSLTGTIVTPVTGTLAGVSPSGVGALAGSLPTPGVITGTLAGSSPSGAGSISGIVGDPTAVRPTISLTHTPVGILSVIPLVPVTELDHAVPITRMSVLAPVLSAEYPAHPAQGEVGAPVVIDGIVGHVHLWIGGQDVTYWRGGMTIINRWESEAPFGDTVAAFSLPQKNPWDVDGEGDLSFLRPDATVAIGIVETTEGDGFTIVRTRRLWSGFLDAQGSGLGDGEFYDYEAKGTLWQAQSNNREPHAITDPVDIGVWIARVLNAVDGRRWATMPLTPIGITTTTRGSRDDMAMEYVQALLTEAITDDLRQWTLLEVSPGILRLVLKPAPTTVHATVAYGTPGVDISLRVDQSTRVDRVFMRGIGPKMGGWANVFYPGLETLTAPAYPMASLGDYIGLGTDDADTVSGTGVTDWQRRVDDLRGFANPPVSGVMSAAWVAVIDDLQRRVGVTADGSLGPQTWNATFDRALRGVDLTPRRLAMASKPEAEKYLYTAAGVRLPGVNPAWDGRVPRDVGIDAGPGKSKAQGFKLARKILGRYGTAAASGTIDWITDPNETDRTRISHLSNIKVLGYHGRDVVVQVASKTVELDGDSDGKAYVVTTRVDERARDATAVEDLLEQRRNAQADPSRNPIARNRASRAVSDQRTPWDSESPCGVLRRTAVNGASGLWTVVTIPFAEVGKLAGIRLKSDRPFAFAIFASLRITENKMAAIVGNPFASSDPWRDEKGLLDEYGIIEAWGEQGNACGYSPKTETDDGAPFTGDFILDTPVDYWTETVPYVSVAIFMRGGSGWIEGEFIPAYET